MLDMANLLIFEEFTTHLKLSFHELDDINDILYKIKTEQLERNTDRIVRDKKELFSSISPPSIFV